jgi:reactive chlorine resistance protein C
MTTTTLSRSLATHRVLDRIDLQAVGGAVIRYGLAGVIGWIGLMKFTPVEAEAIRPLAAHSPLMAWASAALGVRPFSNLVGVAEVTIAALIALRPVAARASALGSALAVGMFATTLSFLLTTPGVWEASLGGFPAISVLPGQFLLKDVVLLGAALWSLGESLARRRG